MDHCPYPCRWVVLILFTGATCCFANKIVAPEHLTTTPSPVIPAARSPPNITVYNGTAEEDANVHYYDQSSQNEFIFQNDTVFVLPTTRTSIKFMCEANYPILWNLAGSKLVRNSYHAIRVLTIRKFEDAFDPTTFTYQSILALEGYGINEELSGKYICRSSQNVELASSIQLFWQTPGRSLYHSGSSLTMQIEKYDDTFVLPCQVLDPSLTPKLTKETSPEKFEDVDLPDMVFAPITGYTLKNEQNSSAGIYRCTEGSDVVTITVAYRNASSDQTKYTFTYDEDNKQVKCCPSGGKKRKPPKIYVTHCEHPSTCALREQVSSSDDVIHNWNQGRRRGSCTVFSLKNPHSNGVIRCAANGQNLFKEYVVPIRGQNLYRHEDRNTTTYFHWSEIEPQEMVEITRSRADSYPDYYYSYHDAVLRKQDDAVYADQTVHLTCQMSRYYFASGNHWMLRWKNQTLTGVPPIPSVDDELDGGYRYSPYYRHGSPNTHSNMVSFVAKSEMESVICFAPVWNSSVWITKIHYLYVNASIPATVLDTKEKLIWYANETDKVLTCHSTGVPEPTFTWTKDNQTIYVTTHNYDVVEANGTGTTMPVTTMSPDTPIEEDENSTTTTSNGTVVYTSLLRISRVSYGTAGEFRCIASNFAGESKMTFHVTVQEAKSWKGPVTLVCASVITFMLMGGIIYAVKIFWKNRPSIGKLASSVNFNDVARRNGAAGGGGGGGGGSNASTVTAGCSISSSGNSSILDDDGNHYSSLTASFDNGKMTNNLIDAF